MIESHVIMVLLGYKIYLLNWKYQNSFYYIILFLNVHELIIPLILDELSWSYLDTAVWSCVSPDLLQGA